MVRRLKKKLFSVQGPNRAILRPHKQRSFVTKMLDHEDLRAPTISSNRRVSTENGPPLKATFCWTLSFPIPRFLPTSLILSCYRAPMCVLSLSARSNVCSHVFFCVSPLRASASASRSLHLRLSLCLSRRLSIARCCDQLSCPCCQIARCGRGTDLLVRANAGEEVSGETRSPGVC